MEKNDLLKHISEAGYNVGYTAKLHFSSYEMIEKIPGLISAFSMVFGIYALVIEGLSTKLISSTLLVLGIVGLYVSLSNSNKDDYQLKGVALTNLFNSLKHLLSETKHESGDLEPLSERLRELEIEYSSNCAPKHIMFATWFAHYKFFWEQQTKWIEEYRPFDFFRDKIPLTLWITIFIAVICAVLNFSDLISYIQGICNTPEE